MSDVQGDHVGNAALPTDFEKAVAYFAKYGNVSSNEEDLKAAFSAATMTQIRNAVWHAKTISKRPEIEIDIYLLHLIWGERK